MSDVSTAWFSRARYGLFVHWGLYSVLGHGEWAFNRERIPVDEYEALASRFTAARYDPRLWAALARDAGMRYAVLTTKHHDGFCLWESRTCPFNATRAACGRDLVAEYVDAFRSAGLRVGLYYSLGDFRHPDWLRGQDGDVPARERFMDYTGALLDELLSGYGRIDILWYDLPQGYSAQEWRTVQLNARARERHPGIVINNRGLTPEDFGTPEQHITASRPGRMWEACMTLNEHWGFVPSDGNFKRPSEVAARLAECASGGGNLLLNVGPDGEGRIPPESEVILRDVGRWLEVHGEAIYDVERHPLRWNLWGPCSVRGSTLYLFLHRLYGETLTLGGLIPQVRRAELLGYGGELTWERRATQTVVRGLPPFRPNTLLPVLRLDLDGKPEQDISRVIRDADVFPDLPE